MHRLSASRRLVVVIAVFGLISLLPPATVGAVSAAHAVVPADASPAVPKQVPDRMRGVNVGYGQNNFDPATEVPRWASWGINTVRMQITADSVDNNGQTHFIVPGGDCLDLSGQPVSALPPGVANDPTSPYRDVLSRIDRTLVTMKQYGMKAVLNVAYVFCRGGGSAGGLPGYWEPAGAALRQHVIQLWGALSLKYRGDPTVVAYDLLNEPDQEFIANGTGSPALQAEYDTYYKDMVPKMIAAIRANDTSTYLVHEPAPFALPRGYQGVGGFQPNTGAIDAQIRPITQTDGTLDRHVIYSWHDYNPAQYTAQSQSAAQGANPITYPGVTANNDDSPQYWDIDTLRRYFQPIREWQCTYGLSGTAQQQCLQDANRPITTADPISSEPITLPRVYVGEIGAQRWEPGAARFYDDTLHLFEHWGWDWTYHDPANSNEWNPTDTTTDGALGAPYGDVYTDRLDVLRRYWGLNPRTPSYGTVRLPYPQGNDNTYVSDFSGAADVDPQHGEGQGIPPGWVQVIPSGGNASSMGLSSAYSTTVLSSDGPATTSTVPGELIHYLPAANPAQNRAYLQYGRQSYEITDTLYMQAFLDPGATPGSASHLAIRDAANDEVDACVGQDGNLGYHINDGGYDQSGTITITAQMAASAPLTTTGAGDPYATSPAVSPAAARVRVDVDPGAGVTVYRNGMVVAAIAHQFTHRSGYNLELRGTSTQAASPTGNPIQIYADDVTITHDASALTIPTDTIPTGATGTPTPTPATGTAIPTGVTTTVVPTSVMGTAVATGIAATAVPTDVATTAAPTDAPTTAIPTGVATMATTTAPTGVATTAMPAMAAATAVPTTAATGTTVPSTATSTPASPTGTSMPSSTTSSPVASTATGTSAAPTTSTGTTVANTSTSTSVAATATSSAVPPTSATTSIPATATSTPIPSTAASTSTSTSTSVPSTSTGTSVPSPATRTPVATDTPTAAPSTDTATPLSVATSTGTSIAPTATGTGAPSAVPPSSTATATNTPTNTATNTPVQATGTSTPVPPTATGAASMPTLTTAPAPSSTPATIAAEPTDAPTPAMTAGAVLTSGAPNPATPRAHYYFAGLRATPGERVALALLNPGPAHAHVRLTLFFADGATRQADLTVAGASQRTIPLDGGTPGRPFGLRVAAGASIGAQATVGRPGRDGDTVAGTPALATRWYLAEGYTGLSFHEWVSLLNPDPARAATVRLRLLPANGRRGRLETLRVPAHSDVVVDANRLLPGQAFGVVAESTRPVLVARALTFSRDGAGQGYGLTMQAGAPTAARRWYLAEGTTVNRFETFLTVLNPLGTPAHVRLALYGRDGRALAQREVVVAANSRATYAVAALARATGIASVVTSDAPAVVEEPEYFGSPNASRIAGSDALGRTTPAAAWLLPGGGTAGRSEFLLLYNPAARAVRVRVTVYGPEGRAEARDVVVPATARATLEVPRLLRGLPEQRGETVRALDGQGIVVERTAFAPDHTALDSTMGQTW